MFSIARTAILCFISVGCTGPLAHHGTIYMGRTVLARSVPSDHDRSLNGIPVKEAKKYYVRAYVVGGDCGNGASSACAVTTQDLGTMVLAAPDHLLEIQYRGNVIVPATLAVELNDNSTLRMLSVTEGPEGHNLLFSFGEQWTGVR